MDKVAQKFHSHREAKQADYAYYQSLAPQDRLNLLLDLVAQEQPHEAQSGLARICSVTQLHRS